MSFLNRDRLTSFLNWMAFVSVPSWIFWLVHLYSTEMQWKNRHSCSGPHIWRKIFCISSINMMLVMGFSTNGVYQVQYVHFYSWFAQCFYYEKVLDIITFYANLNDLVFFVLLTYITLIYSLHTFFYLDFLIFPWSVSVISML
jgi:hypothetical protein